MTNVVARCPKCGNSNARPVGFTWWGGIIGPRLFHRVQCSNCGTQYGGKTGRADNAVILLFPMAALGILFFCLVFGTMALVTMRVVSIINAPSFSAKAVRPTAVPIDSPSGMANPTGTAFATRAVPPAPGVPETLIAAMSKTSGATVFRAVEDLSGSGAVLLALANEPMTEPITPIHIEGEYSGDDYQLRFRGLMAMLFGADSVKGFQVIRVADKTYIYGPAPLLDAPESKWYMLGSDTQVIPSPSPLGGLSAIASTDAYWTSFVKTRSGDSLDGQKCDLYSAGQAAAAGLFAAVVKDGLPSDRVLVVDQGSVNLYICSDGYLHNLVADFSLYDQTSPNQKGKLKYGLDIFGFDSNIQITPPLAPIPIERNAPAVPTVAKTVPTAAPNHATELDGQWHGTTSDGTDISFGVADNRITFLNLSYAVRAGGCSLSGSYSTTPNNAVIKDKGLTLQMTDSSDKQFTFTVTFVSNSQANGMLQVKGPTNGCGNIDTKSTWTATVASAKASPTPSFSSATPMAPRISISTPVVPSSQADARTAVTGFFDRLNAKDIDGALAFVDDDPIVNWGASMAVMSKASLKSLLAGQVNRGAVFQVTINQAVENSIVNFSVKENEGGATYPNCSAILSDGKIKLLTLK